MKTILTLLIISLSCGLLYAQTYQVPIDPTAQSVIPPSPQAYQFAKYGEYPVSRPTGVLASDQYDTQAIVITAQRKIIADIRQIARLPSWQAYSPPFRSVHRNDGT